MHYYHITCRLPNASEEINGIEFEMVEEGEGPDDINHVQTIDPVDEETARQFLGIPGYEIEPVEGAPALEPAKPPVSRPAPRPPSERPTGKKRGRKSNAERAALAAAVAATASLGGAPSTTPPE